MYCVNEFTVRLLLITVLLNLRKITDIVRTFYQNWIVLENSDPRFDLVCGCCKSWDTPANDETEGRIKRDAFTQVDLPGSWPRRRRGRRSKKSTWQPQDFATETVAVAHSDLPPLPVQDFGPAVYTTWQPQDFATETVAVARSDLPPLPVQDFGPAVYTTWQPQDFATETVAVARSDLPPLPVQNFGPAVYTTWQPQDFAMGHVAAAPLRFPPPTLPMQDFGPAVYTTWQPAQPPRMVSVPAPSFGFPRPPPPPTYYVGPVHCRTSV
ncbi:uncharacterized protein LOC132942152 [Metopolophium dirhodum]|uniref:uncharacterized protein LOC132942152 n=1 Tax=Metopolophium dirhodum TaxID=44670 RepID=UPI00298F78C4|nr:uncharacterized protein LOC132942152 [Metopolophium dirhodum]